MEREALAIAREKIYRREAPGKGGARSALTCAGEKTTGAKRFNTCDEKSFRSKYRAVEREALPHVREKTLQTREGSKTGVQ